MRRASGDKDLRIMHRANFVAFVSIEEGQAETAAIYAEANAKWSSLRDYRGCEQEGAWLVGQPAELRKFGTPVANVEGAADIVTATYTRPYIAHASMGPSAAVARYNGDTMMIWSHGQGMHPLRRNIGEN